jgi:hypothetical protein
MILERFRPKMLDATDDMLIMEPPPLEIIFGMTCFVSKNMLLTLTFQEKSQSLSLQSSIVP